MKLGEIIERLSLHVFASTPDAECEVTGGCCCDLLSYVLASAKPGDLWITIQHHANLVGVAQVVGLSAVVVADGRQPDKEALERARAGGVVLLGSSESAFTLCGRLHGLVAAPR